CPNLYARLVLTSMTKFQLVGIAARRQGQDLMPEANAQNGITLLHGPPYMSNGLRAHFRISRAIGDQHAVKFLVQKIVIPWNLENGNIPSKQAPENAILTTTVDHYNAFFPSWIKHRPLDTDLRNNVHFIGILKLNI